MGIPTLNKAAFDVSYAQSGSLYLANLKNVLEQLNLLFERPDTLPPQYQEPVLRRFVDFLLTKNTEWNNERFHGTPTARLINDYTGAFFQRIRPDGYVQSSFTDLVALQTVVSAVYDFALDKFREQKALPLAPLAPLAKWGLDDTRSIETWCVKDMKKSGLQINAGLVAFHAKFRMGGLFAWAVLSHEVGGHSALDSCSEIIEEWMLAIQRQVDLILEGETYGPGLLDGAYWANKSRVEELAADILGVLISGPAFGIGFIGYHRGGNHGKLNLSTSSTSTHPPHILRAVAIAKVIELLNPGSPFIELIAQEIDRDIVDSPSIHFPNAYGVTEIPFAFAKTAAECVATTIMTTPLTFFEGRRLGELIRWEEQDDAIVLSIQKSIQEQGKTTLPHMYEIKHPARYIIPAAILAVTENDCDIPSVFEKMKAYLIQTHERHALHLSI